MSDGRAAQASIAEPPKGAGESGQPEPLLPDWEGPCLHRVVPTLLGHLAHPGKAAPPPWFPAPVADASQIVLLVLDGLGAEQLKERRDAGPCADGRHGRIDHVGRAEHDGVRAHLPRDGEGARRARGGGLPRGPRRRGHERPAVVARRRRCAPPRAGARVPTLRVLPGLGGPRARRHALRLRPDRIHRRAPRPGGPPPVAHPRRSRHGRARAGRRGSPVRVRLLRGHRQGARTRKDSVSTTTTNCEPSIVSSTTSSGCSRPEPRWSSPPTTARWKSVDPSRCSAPRSCGT